MIVQVIMIRIQYLILKIIWNATTPLVFINKPHLQLLRAFVTDDALHLRLLLHI